MPRRRVYRNTRRGQRRRARIHYTKVVNYTSSLFKYNPTAAQWQRATYGPQLPGGTDAGGGTYIGAGYFLNFNFIDIYNNASVDQKAELESLGNIFSKRKLAGVRVSLIPRNNDVFVNTDQKPNVAEAFEVRNINNTFYTIPFHDTLANVTVPNTQTDFARAHSDMPHAHAHNYARGGHHYIKPRVPRVSLSSAQVGGSGSTVVVGSSPAPWMATITDSSATSLNQVWHSGMLIMFPPPSTLQMFDLKLTFYIMYKSHW